MRSRFGAAAVLSAAACVGLILGCPSTGGGGGGGAGNANENENVSANENANVGGGGEVSRPAKSIDLELIGVHDPDSGNYDGDCIGCHGERTGELALDGVTPTAHSTMLTLFGTDNARCTACHGESTDFIAYSDAGIRRQTDVTSCDVCHGETPLPQATAFYMDEG